MSVIRPTLTPPPAAIPQPQQAQDSKLAAQRAFFAAALGQAQPAAAAQAAPAAPTAAPLMRTPDPAAEPPAKILRPGSLLDIRV